MSLQCRTCVCMCVQYVGGCEFTVVSSLKLCPRLPSFKRSVHVWRLYSFIFYFCDQRTMRVQDILAFWATASLFFYAFALSLSLCSCLSPCSFLLPHSLPLSLSLTHTHTLPHTQCKLQLQIRGVVSVHFISVQYYRTFGPEPTGELLVLRPRRASLPSAAGLLASSLLSPGSFRLSKMQIFWPEIQNSRRPSVIHLLGGLLAGNGRGATLYCVI